MRAGRLDTRMRKDQIAQAAVQLVATRGLGALSMAGLARRVGLVPSAIYRHFSGKDEVLDAMLEQLGRRLLSNLDLAAEEAEDPVERLHRLLVRHVQLIRSNQAIPRIIFSEGVFGNRPARKTWMRGLITRYIDGIAGFVLEGQRAGRIRADLDPRAAAVTFLGLILPPAVLWNLTDGEFDVTRQTARGWSVFRVGIEVPIGGRTALPARGKAAVRARAIAAPARGGKRAREGGVT